MSPLMPLKQSKWATRKGLPSIACYLTAQKQPRSCPTRIKHGFARIRHSAYILLPDPCQSVLYPCSAAPWPFLIATSDQIRQPTRAVAELRHVNAHSVHQLDVQVGNRRVARVADVPA